MPDSYTPNLNLTKPEVGASRDTWGTKTNGDWDIVDAIFAAAGNGTSVGLNVGSGKTLSIAGTLTASGTVTLPAAATAGGATIVSTTGTQTLTNKTLTNPAINGFTGDTSVVNIGSGQIYKDTSGNVGIGVSAPGARFQVVGSTTVAGYGNVAAAFGAGSTSELYVGSQNGNAPFVASGGANPLLFQTNGAERMRIDASGNCGIGTSSPLNIANYRNVALQGGSVGCGYSLFNSSGVEGGRLQLDGAQVALINTTATLPTTFSTNNTERARIDPNGNFMFGRTNVSFGSSTGTYIEPFGTIVAERDSQALLFLARVGSNSDGAVANFFWGTGRSFVGNIAVTSTGTSFNSISDYRLKENVVPLTGAAARVQALKPSRFNFTTKPDRAVDGFLAHEAAEVVPEAVIGEKDAVDANGRPIYQGIDQSKLVPLLTAALQEALTEIASLKARVAALENK